MIESDEFALPIKISVHWITRIIFILGYLFFLFLALLSFLFEPQIFTAALFFLFSLFCFYTFIISGATIDIDHDALTLISPLHGVYRIYWEDIQRVEANGDIFAFIGNDKYLTISLRFVGSRKRKFLTFFDNFIQERQLEVSPLSSRWLGQKNTKVGKTSKKIRL